MADETTTSAVDTAVAESTAEATQTTSTSTETASATDTATDGYPDGLGDKGKRALDAERAARRDAEARIKELEPAAARLKEIEDEAKSDLERITEDRDGHKARADQAETELARLKAALKHGLTEDDLDLLGAGTPDEIEARAERLAKRIDEQGKGRRPNAALGRTEETPAATADDWLREQARK